MIDPNSYIGFQLANGIRIVFDDNPNKSVEFEDDDFQKVGEAMKLLQQISFKVIENEDSK